MKRLIMQMRENMKQTYLTHIEDEIRDCGQCSAANMHICIYVNILESNLDLGKIQTYSVKWKERTYQTSIIWKIFL